MSTALNVVLVASVIILAYYFRRNSIPVPTTHINGTYDYIIVGAGAAGTVLANRLSEDDDATVLIVEAGDEEQDPIYDVPWNAPSAQMTRADWMYYSVPQKHGCQGMKDHKQYIPRGRGLGGSTLVNGLVFIRGSRFDFDNWEEQGCSGWSYDDVLPYFKKLEDVRIDGLRDSVYRGKGGPMIVSDTTISEITNVFLKAAEELDYRGQDCNANNGWQKGFHRMQAIVGDSVRWHSARAYLWPAMSSRSNLHVAVRSHVTKVLFEGKTAVGIEMIQNGRKVAVKASREVIISSGAIGSPQLLMLSGIGPAAHLKDMKIPLVADLPVGDNFQDHVMFFVKVDVNESITITPDKINSWSTQLQYQIFGSGYLATNGAAEAVSWICTDPKQQTASFNCPDLQWIFFSSLAEHADAYDHFNYDNEVRSEIYSEIHKSSKQSPEGFTIALQTTHPKSVGSVRLQSTDPFDYPLIDPRYLEDPYDLQPSVRGIRFLQKFLQTKAMQKVGAKLRNKPFSRCKQHRHDSNAYWECLARHTAVSGYHQTSTCKMGAASDQTAVVDPQLRVKGIKSLRVVDASVFPHVTSGNTMVTTIMLAEKAADMIRGKYTVEHLKLKK